MNRANGMSLGERAKSGAALALPMFEVGDPVSFMATLNRKALTTELSLVADRRCAFRLTISMRRSVESQKIVSVIGILAPFSTGAVCVSWLWAWVSLSFS